MLILFTYGFLQSIALQILNAIVRKMDNIPHVPLRCNLPTYDKILFVPFFLVFCVYSIFPFYEYKMNLWFKLYEDCFQSPYKRCGRTEPTISNLPISWSLCSLLRIKLFPHLFPNYRSHLPDILRLAILHVRIELYGSIKPQAHCRSLTYYTSQLSDVPTRFSSVLSALSASW